jgi:hypothetical protein
MRAPTFSGREDPARGNHRSHEPAAPNGKICHYRVSVPNVRDAPVKRSPCPRDRAHRAPKGKAQTHSARDTRITPEGAGQGRSPAVIRLMPGCCLRAQASIVAWRASGLGQRQPLQMFGGTACARISRYAVSAYLSTRSSRSKKAETPSSLGVASTDK